MWDGPGGERELELSGPLFFAHLKDAYTLGSTGGTVDLRVNGCPPRPCGVDSGV